ncbi:MAG: ATP synthase subunit C [Candidatus Hodarchaeota archaeon]
MNKDIKILLLGNVFIFAGLFILIAFLVGIVGILPTSNVAMGTKQSLFEDPKAAAAIAAGIAIGLVGFGASIGMGSATSAAVGAMAERPEIFSKALIFIVLIEAIAIYGFVIAFLLAIAVTS